MFNPMQMINMFNQFKGNPMQALSQFGVPQNMNNPSQIIQHLMNSGKMSQQQFNVKLYNDVMRKLNDI